MYLTVLDILKKLTGKQQVKASKYEPDSGSAYGVSAGRFVGEFFVYIESIDDKMMFLSLPQMKIREITVEHFRTGIDNKIIELQEVLPTEIKQTCIDQYEHAKKSNN
jgi:ribosomal protein L14E/L6E/L27E